MTKRVLVITIGNTDIKAVVKGEEDTKTITTLATIGDRSRPIFCRYLSEQDFGAETSSAHLAFNLLNMSEALRTLKADDFVQPDRPLFIDFNNNKDKVSFAAPKYYKLSNPMCPELLLPKIAPLVSELNNNNFKPDHILVLNTNRQNSKTLDDYIKDKEPYAYGPLIAQWLSKAFNLPYNQAFDQSQISTCEQSQGVYYLDYLTGDALMEGANQNDPINRAALEKIATAIKALCSGTTPSQNELVLSCGGGFPKLKAQLEAVCELYADKVLSYSVPEMHSADQPSVKLANTHHYPSPDVSLRARKQCIALIQHGNFQGAAALALPFVADENKNRCDKTWAQSLIAASEWLQGRENIEQLNDALPAALPFNEQATLPTSLWAAFRIEAALQMGNVQEAIRYTCDFVEVMAQDLLCQSFTPNRFDITAAKKQSNTITNQYKSAIDDLFTPITKKSPEKLINKCFALSIDKQMKYHTKEGNNQRNFLFDFSVALFNLTNNDRPAANVNNKAANTLDDLDNHALLKFEFALRNKSPQTGLSAQDYRNRITHGYLSSTEVAEAKQAFIKAELWSNNGEFGFLAKPLFLDCFRDLTTTNCPSSLYQEFVNALCQKMFSAPISFTEEPVTQ